MKINKIKSQLVNEIEFKEKHRLIACDLIREYGVKKSMRETYINYVRYCLYGDKSISIEKLLKYNRIIFEKLEAIK